MKICLRDGSFSGASMGLAGDNASESPKHLEWVRDPECDTGIVFDTDQFIGKQCSFRRGLRRYAILIEPRCLSYTHYSNAQKYHRQYDAIFSYDTFLVNSIPNGYFMPIGGSWIDPSLWGVDSNPKRRLLSMIMSDKNTTEGHALRHQIRAKYGGRMAIYGRGINPIARKHGALSPFMYSVVIESCRSDYYFSEKLIDCLSVGTVPIYWGCTGIDAFFNTRGMIKIDSIDDLPGVLRSLSKSDYESRMDDIMENLDRARRYRIPEDWLFENYPKLFREAD